MKRFVRSMLVAAVAAALPLVAIEAKAGTILGDLPLPSANFFSNPGEGTKIAVEFTVSSAVTVTSAVVELTASGGTIPTVGIYTGTQSSLSAVPVASFSGTIPLTGVTNANVTFTGSAALSAGTNYFLVIDGNEFYDWISSNGGATTVTGSGATFVGFGPIGGTFVPNGSTRIGGFQINAADPAAVPEPSSLVMAGLGGVAVVFAAARRSRKARAASAA